LHGIVLPEGVEKDVFVVNGHITFQAQETALAAGSWEARRYLGLPCIEEGALADITAYPDDPRGNLEVLSQPTLRMLGA
jgi:imidazolonepropionase-like amidohydrolase